MRDYGKVAPTFWTRGSGKALRGDAAAQVVALYLMTCPNATMTGIYYLPLPTLAHETGLGIEGASEALRRACEAGLAEYDEEAELVWVPNLARYQVGDELKVGDKRVVGLVKALETNGNHSFVQAFYELYGVAYKLPKRRFPRSPPEGASEALRSQKQEQKQDQKNKDSSANAADAAEAAESLPDSTGATRGDVHATDVREVFAHWSSKLCKRKPLLSDKRRRVIRARLVEGYTADELKRAVDGCAKSAFHIEGGHTDVVLICRDAPHVDRFIAIADGSIADAHRPSGAPSSGRVNGHEPPKYRDLPTEPEMLP